MKSILTEDFFNYHDFSKFASLIFDRFPNNNYQTKIFVCKYKDTPFITKIGYYIKTSQDSTPEKKISQHQIDAEINILLLFKKDFIDTCITPCIIEIMYSKIFDNISTSAPPPSLCDNLALATSITQNEDLMLDACYHTQLVKNGLAFDKCAFIVLEYCELTFYEYLNKDVNILINAGIFLSLLFQILYTLHAIQYKYPNFRHNDLHINNILLHLHTDYHFDSRDLKFLVFTIAGTQYAVPFFGITIKIIDFGYSVVPEANIISNIVENPFLIFKCGSNDVVRLFADIYNVAYSNSNNLGAIPYILEALDPTKSYIRHHNYQPSTAQIGFPSVLDILQNKVFEHYREPITKKQIYMKFNPPQK